MTIKLCLGNLVEVNIDSGATPFSTSTRSSLKDKLTIAYDPTTLKLIYNQSNHDQWRIYIHKFPVCAPPQQDQILSFLPMFSPKSACVRGWCPLQ